MSSLELNKYLAICIIEKDINSDTHCVWIYPKVSEEEEKVLVNRCGLTNKNEFRFARFQGHWQYYLNQECIPSSTYPVVAVSLVLLSQNFFPEKYYQLLALFLSSYQHNPSPINIQKLFLEIYCVGKCSFNQFNFIDNDFDDRKALLGGSIKTTISLFQEQSVLIWVAMLCQKRVFVYSDQIDNLLSFIRTLPQFVWHRQDLSYMFPFNTISPVELNDFRQCVKYISGFTDFQACQMVSDYDLLINIPTKSISFPDHSQEDFTLSQTHKDFVNQLLSLINEPSTSEQTVIKYISKKNSQLFSHLQEIMKNKNINALTFKDISSESLPPNTDRFLYNIALAEKIAKS